MKYVFGVLVLILIVLHQDYWQWSRTEVVFGFVPYALAYHMGISIVTAMVWLLAVNLCWSNSAEENEIADPDGNSSSDKGAN